MILTFAIFYTITLVVVIWIFTYEGVDMIPYLKDEWNKGNKMNIINFSLLMLLLYTAGVFAIIGIWNTI